MVPLVLSVFAAVLAAALVLSLRPAWPRDLEIVVWVRDVADGLEDVLLAAHVAGVARLTVVDEGASGPVRAVAAVWARRHPGVRLVAAPGGPPEAPAQLVLDLRHADGARQVDGVLSWLAGRGMRRGAGVV